MDYQRINYIMEALRMTEEVETTDPNTGITTTKRVDSISGEQRTQLINELVKELTETTTT